ncbi:MULTISPECIES: cyclic nucleotide-binding domain-containing protein [Methylomonas]|uniref:Crp/Fnr family transcriptional regulator n=2 Tax=Methylomonas TaxID=416 RepID=A0A126T4V6_9GAMM|nr:MULTISPECIES: cyclic nucleotide-binding domain-containing protein [Methylomonas]AMK77121.1 Crp/Fnr family transcriptional regulator [Methylomonas denitrificans]OAH97139.1 Crp/Fnr family transcriptional regulator [Methylomonas methanica]TCV82632.1 rhodanese-like domain-containing protein [Methylomonas methanica]
MAVDIHSAEGRVIRQLIPLSTLPFNKFEALCAQIKIEDAEEGQFLFKCGDERNDLVYLIDGSVTLQTDLLKIETIKSDSPSARFALAHQIPRKVHAVASSRIRFLRLNADMMKSAQDVPYEETESFMVVDEVEDNDDWMTTLLKSPVFRALPPANLQKILIGMQEIRVDAGAVIVNQGEPGDFYYIIKKGQCLVSRKPAPNAKEIKLAQLSDQDTFGEDALISGEPRNVSVSALTDVSLLRLGKEQFLTLIKQPTLKYISYKDAQDLVAKGADLIDVREPDEYKPRHLPLSINLPFFSLRMQLKTLNRQHPIVVVCQNGKISETAAFILMRHKFNALILSGGIDSISPDELKAPSSFPIDDGIETSNFRGISGESETNHSFSEQSSMQDDMERLRRFLQQLKTKYNILEAEKKALEMKYLALAKFTESLKAELEAIKKAGGGG